MFCGCYCKDRIAGFVEKAEDREKLVVRIRKGKCNMTAREMMSAFFHEMFQAKNLLRKEASLF